jgi:hypothetical protein
MSDELEELRKLVAHFMVEYQDEVSLSILKEQQDSLINALLRADRLITWMSQSIYIANMVPGSYTDCYKDLNDHNVFMDIIKPKGNGT